MLGKIYTVKSGDTLWDIAGKQLGSHNRWPEIVEHNNSPMVMGATGLRISNPDLIFVGQKIYIPEQIGAGAGRGISPPSGPRVPAPPAPASPGIPTARQGPNTGKTRASQKVRSVPFKYDLSSLPTITIASPTHIATVALKGSVTLQGSKAVEFATLTRQGFELEAKRAADHALGKLVTGTQVGYNPVTRELSFECGLTAHSNQPYAPTTKATMGISATTGLPVAKGVIQAPDIKGKIADHLYLAAGLGIAIEVTPLPPSAKPKPVPIPSARPAPGRVINWDYLVGGAMVVGAGVIIVATIVEDIATAGLGIADDAPSFAAAAALFAGGTAMFKTVQGGTPIAVEGEGANAGGI